MNPEELQKKIAEYFAKLPVDMQTMFASMEWMKTLENISTKFSLTTLQIQSLGTETTLLLLGIIHPDEFDNFIRTEMSLTKDTADKIIVEINLGILNKWRTALGETYEKNVAGEAERVYGGDVKLDDRFAKLPPEIKDAITNSNYQAELASVAKAKGLSIDDMGKLEQVVNKVMLGIDHPESFEQNLKQALGVDSIKAGELTNEINEKVFKNIREVLKSHADVHAEPVIPTPQTPKTPTNIEPEMPPLPPKTTQNTNTPNPTQSTMASDKIMQTNGIEIEKTFDSPLPNTTWPNTLNDKNLIQKAGVSIIDDKPIEKNQEIKDEQIEEQNIMAGIENPSSIKVAPLMKHQTMVVDPAPAVVNTTIANTPNIDIIQSKLAGVSVNVRSASSQDGAVHKSDPYREPIE